MRKTILRKVRAVRVVLRYGLPNSGVMKLKLGLYGHILGFALLSFAGRAADSDGTVEIAVTNGTKSLLLPLVSGIDAFKVLATTNLGLPLAESIGAINGYKWSQPGEKRMEF